MTSAYHMLFQGSIQSTDNEIIWKAKAAPRAKAFSWLLLRGKCLTADNLAKRQIPHDPLCPFCQQAPETAMHLIANCPFSTMVWTRTAATLGPPDDDIQLHDRGRLRQRFRRQTSSLPKANRPTWRVMCLLVAWCL